MIDQADALRNLVRDRGVSLPRRRRSDVYKVAITSGKGGVGKTSLATNLAITLAAMCGRAWLIDADFGLSNAEVLLGVKPKYTLEDVARGRIDPSAAWTDCGGGLRLISSGTGLDAMANLDGITGAELINWVLESVPEDGIVVIDTAPGIDDSVISLLSLADEVLVVTTPEPTSITDSYAAIKVLTQSQPDCQISLVSNCCSSPSQAGVVAKGLDGICKRFLARSFQRHEYVPSDAAVRHAILTRRPFATHAPNSPATVWLRRMAIKLTERRRKSHSSHAGPALVEV
ncbi:MAG: P-loop NTPase [Armatimonadota bacterium]